MFNGSAKATGDSSYWAFGKSSGSGTWDESTTACSPGSPWSEADLGHDGLERRPNSAVMAIIVAFDGRLAKVGDDPIRPV